MLVKPVRRACARGWKFGQNASLRARAVRAKFSLAGLTTLREFRFCGGDTRPARGLKLSSFSESLPATVSPEFGKRISSVIPSIKIAQLHISARTVHTTSRRADPLYWDLSIRILIERHTSALVQFDKQNMNIIKRLSCVTADGPCAHLHCLLS